jgi:SAM-dependent methyltransferase
MVVERLHFGDAALNYNAISAAEHVVRYHSVRELCRGKRVLDVSCGEGYGSALLAKWGAAQVVGIDVSSEAVTVAEQVFARPNIQFVQGDACQLTDVLGDIPGFDLIVSFETIEHVRDVPGLLAGIKQYSAAGGTIVISCPNDHVEEEDNPYHLRSYTFDEFRETTTAILGPASGWLLGTPAHGQLLYPAGDTRMENGDDSRMMLLTECNGLPHAAVIPAQPNIAPSAANCKFYVGYWGNSVSIDAVVSPQSFLAFAEPWRAIAYFKQQREQLIADRQALFLTKADVDRQLADLRIVKADVDRQLADLRHRALVQARAARRQLDQGAELERTKSELKRLSEELEQWRAVQKSRTYRITQAYYRTYSLPMIGPVLERFRRVAGAILRKIHGTFG